jgi:hypothetical protein
MGLARKIVSKMFVYSPPKKQGDLQGTKINTTEDMWGESL